MGCDVTIYTLEEFGRVSSHAIEVSEAEADAMLEAQTLASERRLGRTRVPHTEPSVGIGFKVGSGDDPVYELVLLSRW